MNLPSFNKEIVGSRKTEAPLNNPWKLKKKKRLSFLCFEW